MLSSHNKDEPVTCLRKMIVVFFLSENRKSARYYAGKVQI